MRIGNSVSLGLAIAFLTGCGGSGGSGSSNQTTGPYVIDKFSVDDIVTVSLNGTVIYQDGPNAGAGTRGPFTLTGSKVGDTVQIKCQDRYGGYYGHQEIDVTRPNGKKVVGLQPNFIPVPTGQDGTATMEESFTL